MGVGWRMQTGFSLMGGVAMAIMVPSYFFSWLLRLGI
jgi:hypothetical protein